MDPLWQKVRAIFEDGLELDGEELERHIVARCSGDVALLDEVRSLFAAHSTDRDIETGGFLGSVHSVDEVLPTGTQLGEFTLAAVLAHGGMGVVYVARQRAPFRTVAVKVLSSALPQSEAEQRFRFEIEALGRMRHPAIASILDAGIHEWPDGRGCPYFAMDLVDGASDLMRWSQRGAGRSLQARLEIFAVICDAVQHGHERGVLHRDLKPSNILVGADGRPKLIDFGIAQAVDASGSTRNRVTTEGSLIGTVQYMSPEQVEGRRDAIDLRVDVYALGVVLFELLTGRPPIDLAGVALADVARALRAASRRPCAVDPTLPPELDAVVAMATAYEPDDRYASVEAMAEDLRRVLRCEPVVAAPPSLRRAIVLSARRHRGLIAAAVCVVVALAVGLAWSRSAAAEARDAAVRASRAMADARGAEGQLRAASRDVLDLAARRKLREVVSRADAAWPAEPEQLDELRSIAALGDELAARLPALEGALHELRARALASDEVDEGAGLATHPASMRLAGWRDRAAAWRDRIDEKTRAGAPEPQLAGLQMHLAEYERAVAHWSALVPTRIHATFAAALGRPADLERWRHRMLTEIVYDLRKFVRGRPNSEDRPSPCGSSLPAIHRRVEWVESVERASLTSDGARDRWRAMREEFAAAGARYGETLPPAPRFGLLPIGRDPDSGLLEFADLRTGTAAERDAGGRLVLTEDSGLVFVLLPGSSGATEPRIAPFLCSKFELTRAQWMRFEGRDRTLRAVGTPTGEGRFVDRRHPVADLAFGFVSQTLGRIEMTLPSERQWEYACRAGVTTRWSCGDDPRALAAYANLRDRTIAPFIRGGVRKCEPWSDGFTWTAPVGSFAANGFGLHDMHGNVAEVCGPPSNQEVLVRGGAYSSFAASSAIDARAKISTKAERREIGVRPVILLLDEARR